MQGDGSLSGCSIAWRQRRARLAHPRTHYVDQAHAQEDFSTVHRGRSRRDRPRGVDTITLACFTTLMLSMCFMPAKGEKPKSWPNKPSRSPTSGAAGLRRCRLESIKAVAKTLKNHWLDLLNAFDSRLTNGRVEAVNSLIQFRACQCLKPGAKPNVPVSRLEKFQRWIFPSPLKALGPPGNRVRPKLRAKHLPWGPHHAPAPREHHARRLASPPPGYPLGAQRSTGQSGHRS